MAKKQTRVVGTTLELMDGGTCRLVLNYGLMRAMSRKHPDAYAATMRVLGGSEKPSLEDVWSTLWMAYLGGCEYSHTKPMEEDEFYVQAGSDYYGAMSAFAELVDPNHRTPTAGRL